MADKSPAWIQQEERIDHQLVRGIGIPALTANIVSSTIGAGIFVIPATVAKGLGSSAPLAFVCCAIAMVLFVTCFAIAGSRVSLTGGLYAYVEVAFGRYVGFLAGMLYFLTALGAVAGVVNVLANSVALVIPFLGGPIMRIVVMLAVYGSLVLINTRDPYTASITTMRMIGPPRNGITSATEVANTFTTPATAPSAVRK